MMTHLQLPLDPDHFSRWLFLFAETANEILSPDHAAMVVTKSQRIAENFRTALPIDSNSSRSAATNKYLRRQMAARYIC